MIQKEKPAQLSTRVLELRARLAGLNPSSPAWRTGSNYHVVEQEFHLAFWGRRIILTYPGYVARYAEAGPELPVFDQALLLYYFNICDGEQAAGRWIAFSELPDGRFYNQAFQGYTGQTLTRAFGEDLEAFDRAAAALGGLKTQLGDSAFRFQALPNVPLLAVYYLGDEDFPPSARILFDAAASHHLPTDACAILGSRLTQKLVRQKIAPEL